MKIGLYKGVVDMKVVKLKKISTYIICFIICLLAFTLNAKANSKDTDLEVQFCTPNKEYLKWEKLSAKKKKTTLMPPMCDPTADKIKKTDSKFNLMKEEFIELPEKYDGRQQTYIGKVKDQQDTGSCWAFSTTSTLEMFAKKQLELDFEFSPRHIVYSSVRNFINVKVNEFGYNITPSTGGNFFMSSNYLINLRGPVLEEDMPFENNENYIEIDEIMGKNIQLDINDISLNYDNPSGTVCPETEIEKIKQYVYEYGSVLMTTYLDGAYYNYSTSSYYYNGTSGINHAVTIVGWDDNYSRTNFLTSNRPTKNGAWIIQNSYGDIFGDKGYYYVSYEDVHVCDVYMAIQSADQKIEDNAYIHDKLGFNTFIGYTIGGEPITTGYAMNVFTKEEGKKEVLKEIAFGTSGVGNYSIYYFEGKGSNTPISKMTLIGTGTTNTRGYATYKLEEDFIIDKDVTNFSIAIYYEMVDSTRPIPLSSSSGTFYKTIISKAGQSYISGDGNTWADLINLGADFYIASIKAFTDDYIKIKEYEVDEEDLLIYVSANTPIEEFNKNVILGTNNNEEIISESGKIYTGLTIGTYTVIVKGDVTVDGYVRMNDVMKISNYIVDGTGLDEDYLKIASDINKDELIKMNDVMKISNYIVEGGEL